MRHRVKTNNLNRTSEHRLALFRNMAINLFTWSPEKIEAKAREGQKLERTPFRHYHRPYQMTTSIAKAKSARSFIDKCVTLAKKAIAAEKDGNVSYRRQLISKLGGTATAKRIAKILIAEIAPGYNERAGGYTRILRLPKLTRPVRRKNQLPGGKKMSKFLGSKLGDNTELCLLELVEFDGQAYIPAMTKLLPDDLEAGSAKPTGEATAENPSAEPASGDEK
ncbi:MAG: L17 family ribosomal protein [Planctomycetota bacterium]